MNTVQSTGHANVRNKKDSQFEELTVSSSEKRNWRGIFIALLVIAAVLGLIVFSILLLSPEIESSRLQGKRISLQDLLAGRYEWRAHNGTWLSKFEYAFINADGNLALVYIDEGKVISSKVLMKSAIFRLLNTDSFIISPDRNFVLLYSHLEAPYNTSYYIYEIDSSIVTPLSIKEGDQTAPRLQNVLWAPGPHSSEGSGGTIEKGFSQGIAFVHDGDIYYKPKVQGDLICRITTSGKTKYMWNGVPDWLYSNVEELKSATLSFSPDGEYLSYLSFNVSNVHQYQFIWYGNNDQYPSIRSIRYPKINSPNPSVVVHAVDLSVLKFITQKSMVIPPYISDESYVGGMTWISPDELSITYTNREQNLSHTMLCAAPQFNCIEIFSERAVEKGWTLIAEAPLFIRTEINHAVNGSQGNSSHEVQEALFMLKRLSIRDGLYGYFRHLTVVPIETKKPIILTIGRYEVTEILGYDAIGEYVYYMATIENKPGQRHLYKANLTLHHSIEIISMNAKNVVTQCITCISDSSSYGSSKNAFNTTRNDEAQIPNNCMYNRIYFNSDYSYFIQECLGPESPSSYIVDATTEKKIYILDDGNHLRSLLFELAKPQIMTFSVQIKYNFYAQVRVYLPPGIAEDDDVLLPLILHVDATPESQLVSDKYYLDWNWYLCSFQSYIIAQIDARGSGFQGESLKTQIRGKVGIEVEDQLSVLTYLRDNVKLVDANRICAYGWGYGGYIVSMMIASDTGNVIKCGVALNPIVSFKYFNSFFTERYVTQPGDNGRSLQDTDLSMKAGNFANKKMLLVHGTADTLVHEQNTALLTKALIEANVMFRHQIYVDVDHDMTEVKEHVYHTIESFFEENFQSNDQDWTTVFFLSKS